jgi:hypothetical protein
LETACPQAVGRKDQRELAFHHQSGGSYYLSANIAVTTKTNGIQINAEGVTLDLNGPPSTSFSDSAARGSRLFIFAKFLEARIAPKRVEHGIEPKQGRSQRRTWTKRARIRCRHKLLENGNSAIGFSKLRGHASKNLEGPGTGHRVFLYGESSHRLLCEPERGHSITKGCIRQREMAKQSVVFRLFVEERFELVTRLPPSFPRSGMGAGDFLGPTQPKAQFAIGITQGRIRLGEYFL